MPCLKTNPAGTVEQQDTSLMQVQGADYFEFEIQPPHDTFQFQAAKSTQLESEIVQP